VIERSIEGHVVRVTCEGIATALVEDLFLMLRDLARDERGLANGRVIRFGPALFRLAARGSVLVVGQPEFGDAGPTGFSEDVTSSLQMCERQGIVATVLDVDEVVSPIDFELGAYGPGWKKAPFLALERTAGPDTGRRLTGWYLAPGTDEPSARRELDEALGPDLRPDKAELLGVHRLLAARPGVVAALSLPPGWSVVFRREAGRDALIRARDPEGRDRTPLKSQ
jgi:hypothetical protein